MIKGSATIQLFDAKTGELEKEFKEENMITNAAYNLMNGDSCFDAFTDSLVSPRTKFSSLLDSCFGGILLFEESITEDANILSMPSDNKMVGNASGSYTGADSKTGNLNISESGSINDGKGYKYVWDFATDKANGTIKCAALTSRRGGRSGYEKDRIHENSGINFFTDLNNFSDESKYSNADLIRNPLLTGGLNQLGEYRTIGNFEKNKFTACSCKANDNTVNFKVLSVNKKVHLNSNIDYTCTERTVTSSKKLAQDTKFFAIGNKIYSIHAYNKNILDIVIFNGITFEIEKEETLTIQDVDFNCVNDVYSCKNPVLYKDYYYVNKNNTLQYYKINKNDISDYSIIDIPKFKFYNTSGSYSREVDSFSVTLFNNLMLFIPIHTYDSSSNYGEMFLYNGERLVSAKITMYISRFLFMIESDFIKPPYVLIATHNYYGNDPINVFVNIITPFLSTINNLTTPVVKNETQTMKVTYEITEV